MIPIHDDNPTRLRPVVTVTFIGLCSLVFLWQLALPQREEILMSYALGAVPAVVTGAADLPPQLRLLPGEMSLLTYMFLHGGWMHIIVNMLYLWVFGNNVEDSMGHGRFVAFYLLCGVLAGLGHVVMAPQSTVPMIGASGAVSGVLGAYLLLYPKARVLVLIPLFVILYPVRVPAAWMLLFWIGLQIFNWLALTPDAVNEPGVAWVAHIAGFFAGMALIPVFKRRNVPLFRGRSGPWG